MKRPVSHKPLPLLPAATGLIALLLRLALYTMENESSLLPHNHPLYIASLALAAATAAAVLFFILPLKGSAEYRDNFPASRTAAAGSLIAGALLVPVAFGVWKDAFTTLDQIWAVLTFASSVCLLVSGWCQWTGKQPHFAMHVTVCLFYALHMICQYRVWSGNPQVEDYIFSLFGCIFLALFAFHRVAFAAGAGHRRMLLFCGLMAVFFCLPALIGGNNRCFFLSGGIWTVTNLGVIDPPKTQTSGEV